MPEEKGESRPFCGRHLLFPCLITQEKRQKRPRLQAPQLSREQHATMPPWDAAQMARQLPLMRREATAQVNLVLHVCSHDMGCDAFANSNRVKFSWLSQTVLQFDRTHPAFLTSVCKSFHLY